MTDRFATYSPGLDDPCDAHYVITPGAADLNPRPRSLYVNAPGNATIEDKNGVSITYTNLAQGQILPFRGRKVTAATATLIAWE